MLPSIGLPQLVGLLLAVLLIWSIWRPRGPFGR
jgi:hypothetical protein